MHEFMLALHLLGAMVVIGADGLTILLTRRQPLSPERWSLLQQGGMIGLYGMTWQFLTGLHLYTEQIDKLTPKPLFWVKIGIVILSSVLNYAFIQRRFAQSVKAGGPISLPKAAVWPSIVFATTALVVICGIILTNITHHD